MRTMDETSGQSGATPVPELHPADAPDRKERKREARHRRDAQRLPKSYERFRILLEVIAEQRHVVDLEDHRARYAMIIMGAINAAMYLIGSRAARSGELPAGAEPWLVALAVVYTAASVFFILAVIHSLRPRTLDRKGLLNWEGALMQELAEYEAGWREARMDQLNQEAAQIAHLLARMIGEKCRANQQLYRGLAVLVILGAVALAVLAVASFAG